MLASFERESREKEVEIDCNDQTERVCCNLLFLSIVVLYRVIFSFQKKKEEEKKISTIISSSHFALPVTLDFV